MLTTVFLLIAACAPQTPTTAPEQAAFEARNRAVVHAAEKQTSEGHPGWRVEESTAQSEPSKGLFRASLAWVPAPDSSVGLGSLGAMKSDRVVVSFQSFATEADAAKRLDAVLAHSSLKRDSPVVGLGAASFRLNGFVDPGRTVVIFRLGSTNVTVDAPTSDLAGSFARDTFKALAAKLEEGLE